MATIIDNLFDIHLLCNDTDKNTYGCGQCGKLATNAKGLRCDEKYHDQTPTLYCDKCAILIQTANKCPVNQHENPTFSDEKLFQAQIQKNVKFMCPYSLHQNNHDEKKQHTNDLCQWNGTYIQLQNHVKVCKYKPKKTFQNIQKANEIEKDKQIVELRNQINILKEKMCSVETFQNVVNKKTAKKEQKIAQLQKEIKLLKRAMNCCDCCKSSGKVWIIIGFICCILLVAIIAANYNNLMILYRETSNIYISKVRGYGNETTVRIELLVKQFDELNATMKLCNISVSELETMVKNFQNNCTKNITVLNANIERMDSRIDNMHSMAMQTLNKDIRINSSEISLWDNKMKQILYYTGKLFGHGVNMFYLFHSCSAHVRLNSVYRWKLLMVSVISYLVVNIYYFYYVNWIVMFIVIGFGFVGVEIVHNNGFESVYVNENCFLLIVELNVLYWRIWCNDDKILVTLVCGLWIYLVSVLKGKIPQQHFAVVFSVVSLCINCLCILEWI